MACPCDHGWQPARWCCLRRLPGWRAFYQQPPAHEPTTYAHLYAVGGRYQGARPRPARYSTRGQLTLRPSGASSAPAPPKRPHRGLAAPCASTLRPSLLLVLVLETKAFLVASSMADGTGCDICAHGAPSLPAYPRMSQHHVCHAAPRETESSGWEWEAAQRQGPHPARWPSRPRTSCGRARGRRPPLCSWAGRTAAACRPSGPPWRGPPAGPPPRNRSSPATPRSSCTRWAPGSTPARPAQPFNSSGISSAIISTYDSDPLYLASTVMRCVVAMCTWCAYQAGAGLRLQQGFVCSAL